jgi:hypothetical protein
METVLYGKLEETDHVETQVQIRDNIKKNLKETGCENFD